MKIDAEKLAEQCESVAALLKAIAHPQRLKILCLLCEGEKTVSEIEEYCGATQSMVSIYLAKMKSERLVASTRQGRYVFYRIDNKDLLLMMRSMQKIFCAP